MARAVRQAWYPACDSVLRHIRAEFARQVRWILALVIDLKEDLGALAKSVEWTAPMTAEMALYLEAEIGLDILPSGFIMEDLSLSSDPVDVGVLHVSCGSRLDKKHLGVSREGRIVRKRARAVVQAAASKITETNHGHCIVRVKQPANVDAVRMVLRRAGLKGITVFAAQPREFVFEWK
jgi:hypothetical protein